METIDQMTPKEILTVLMNFPLEVDLEIFRDLASKVWIEQVIYFIEDYDTSNQLSSFAKDDIINLKLYPIKIIDNDFIMRSIVSGKLYRLTIDRVHSFYKVENFYNK